MNENEVSDRRWKTYLEQKASAEPLDEFSGEVRRDLSTDKPIEDLRRASEQFLRADLPRTVAALILTSVLL